MKNREKVLQIALKIIQGDGSFLSQEVKTQPGRCAQFVRELVEYALGLKANSWPVAIKAAEIAVKNGRIRWATDYEKANKLLNLTKNTAEAGDIFYWPYKSRDGNAYGHTAIYLGQINGQEMILENTDANRGKAIFAQGSIRLTPLSIAGKPIVIAGL